MIVLWRVRRVNAYSSSDDSVEKPVAPSTGPPDGQHGYGQSVYDQTHAVPPQAAHVPQQQLHPSAYNQV